LDSKITHEGGTSRPGCCKETVRKVNRWFVTLFVTQFQGYYLLKVAVCSEPGFWVIRGREKGENNPIGARLPFMGNREKWLGKMAPLNGERPLFRGGGRYYS
jgi:hypothetical protein